MPKKYVSIQTVSLKECRDYFKPHTRPQLINEDNPALDAMVDFQHKQPLVIAQDMRMYDARVKMECSDLPFILVHDEHDELVGALSLDQVLSGKTISLIQKRRVVRKSILVKDVMTPMDTVLGFNWDDIQHVKVGNVIRSLKESAQDYALVVDNDRKTGTDAVRGVFLASLMSKQIGRNILQQDDEAVGSVLGLMQTVEV